MKSVSVGPVPLLLTTLLFASLNGLTACGGGSIPLSGTGNNITLSVSPQPASVPVNGSVTFTATTNDSTDEVSWGIIGNDNCADCTNLNLGSPASGQGKTFVYTAPPTPPIYTADTIPPGTPPGSVCLRVLDLKGGPMVQFNIPITTPSITTGFLSAPNVVTLGQTLSIDAYAVGSVNNAITMQVNGISGGSATYGTITPVPNANYFYGYYTYTAPAKMPATGNTVTVTVISQADPTKSSSTTITLTSP